MELQMNKTLNQLGRTIDTHTVIEEREKLLDKENCLSEYFDK
jgi:hypothetical protein